jgi:hypothetical protein
MRLLRYRKAGLSGGSWRLDPVELKFRTAFWTWHIIPYEKDREELQEMGAV